MLFHNEKERRLSSSKITYKYYKSCLSVRWMLLTLLKPCEMDLYLLSLSCSSLLDDFTNLIFLYDFLAICGGRPLGTDNQDTHAERQRGKGRGFPGFEWSGRQFPLPQSRISRRSRCPAGMWHPRHWAEPLSYIVGHWRRQPQQPGSVQTTHTWPCLRRGCESGLCFPSSCASTINIKRFSGFSLWLHRAQVLLVASFG